MKIVDIKATTIAMPLEAPLRHAAGAHWGRFVRTIVEVVDRRGPVRLGEMGGGGEIGREGGPRAFCPISRATIRCSSSSCAGRS